MLDIFDCGEPDQYFYDDEGMFWVQANLLSPRLGFKNVSQSLSRHTLDSERQQPEWIVGYLNTPWFVNETGIWRLVIKSTNKTCEQFKEKLVTEILPAIRKNGSYVSDTASLDQLTVLLRETEDKVSSMAMDLELAELKVSQMAEYIQGESDRTRAAKEAVTEDAIKESVVEFICNTDDDKGDPLVFQTYLKSENSELKRVISDIQSEINCSRTKLAESLKRILSSYNTVKLLG